MQLSEIDLFFSASENPILVKSFPEAKKTMYKVWSGLTKFIRSTLVKGKSAMLVEFGKFLPTVPVKFIPSANFLTQTKVHYRSPGELPDSTAFQEQNVSYSSIADVCGLERDIVAQCVKEIIHQLSLKISLGFTVLLHFKVGDLTVSKGWAEFGGATKFNRPEGSTCMSVCTPRSSRYTAFSDTASFHASNPNPLHQGVSLNLNNYYRGLKYKTDNSLLAPVAFYTGQIHPIFNFRNRFTRKQACEQPVSPEELLRMHKQQILEKKAKKELEKQKEFKDDCKTLQGFNQTIKTEKNVTNVAEAEIRKNYALANIKRAENKRRTKESMSLDKKNETYDFFPFTHGDEVEAHQRELKAKQNNELQNYLKSVENSPVCLSKELTVTVPVFLQCSEYTNVRRKQNNHVELTMKGSLETYHQELKGKEKEKIKEKRERDEQALVDSVYYKQLEMTRKKELEANLNSIHRQIEDKAQKKALDRKKETELYQTSLDIANASPEKMQEKKDMYKGYQKDLVKQMREKDSVMRKSYEKERDIDTKMLSNVEQFLNGEDQEARLRETYAKTLNRDVWLKQIEIKALEKESGVVL